VVCEVQEGHLVAVHGAPEEGGHAAAGVAHGEAAAVHGEAVVVHDDEVDLEPVRVVVEGGGDQAVADYAFFSLPFDEMNSDSNSGSGSGGSSGIPVQGAVLLSVLAIVPIIGTILL